MPIRNRIKVGDYLMVDDESGLTHYASEMVKIWDGSWRHRSNYETRQPQEFVKARRDPKALRNVRAEPLVAPPFNALGAFIGNTTVPVGTGGAAAHLYDLGIGDMEIGYDFFVR